MLPRRGNNGTVGLNFNLPLFASGATESKVREALALRDKAQTDLQSADRAVTLAVRQNHAAVLTAVARAHGLETAVRSQQVALRAARRGYEVGMKTNRDVLDAQSLSFEAQRDLAHACVDAWQRLARLQLQAGSMAAAQLHALDAALVTVPAPPPPAPADPPSPAVVPATSGRS